MNQCVLFVRVCLMCSACSPAQYERVLSTGSQLTCCQALQLVNWYQAAPPRSVFWTLSGCAHQLRRDRPGESFCPSVNLFPRTLQRHQPSYVQKLCCSRSSVSSTDRQPVLTANCDRSDYGCSHWIISTSFDLLYQAVRPRLHPAVRRIHIDR